MHKKIDLQILIELLKCIPLHSNQIWRKYAYWKIRFQSSRTLPTEALFRTLYGQVQRPDKELDSFSQKQAAFPNAQSAHGLLQS